MKVQIQKKGIQRYQEEDVLIASKLFEAHYDELLQLSRARRRKSGFRDTMQTSDILHEAFLKLSGKTVWQSPDHFMRTAALAIRQVVVDYARRNLTKKHGGNAKKIPFSRVENFLPEFGESPEQIVVIDDLLGKLERAHPRLILVVDARYFSGMTEKETAEALGVSARTVRRDWHSARSWLQEHI